MQIGIDSFAAVPSLEVANNPEARSQALNELLERIELADKMGLHHFGMGEHYRKEFLDSAPTMILAAAASRTENIILRSAVTVISAADPVRIFQHFATLDLITRGRAEMVVGRGSFIESFPLFGLDLDDYDLLFEEKLRLLLKIRAKEFVNWDGKFRPAMDNLPVYPRPYQEKLPVWIGVGGTPQSFLRAGLLGLPLMVAVIGGETHRFKQLVDLYWRGVDQAGHDPSKLEVGLHSLGFVGRTTQQAKDDYFPGYERTFNRIGKERGWPPVTRQSFEAQAGYHGALVIGSPEEVAEKLIRHSEALGGITRFSFMMDSAGLTHNQFKEAIQLIGEEVIPLVKDA